MSHRTAGEFLDRYFFMPVGPTEARKDRLKTLRSSVLLGRLDSPDEIAKAVVFLASDDSRFIIGIELLVDGGFA